MNREDKKEKLLELSSLIKRTGELYANILSSDKIDDKIEEILELETKGDEIQDILDKDFATQKNIPYLAIDRAKLLRRMDNILDNFRIASLTYKLYHKYLPDDFDGKISVISEKITVMSDKLSVAIDLIYTDFSKSLEVVDQIEKIRDETQDITFDIEGAYFNSLDGTTGWKSFQAVSQIIKKTTNCIRSIKSASEILTLMAYKYS